MNLKSLLPKSIRSLRGAQKTNVAILGGLALGATALYLLHRTQTVPRSPGSRVMGAFTDLAKSLGMDIGASLDVKTAQGYLNHINNAGLAIDGILGPNTIAALKAFQAGNNIEQTGRIDEETGNALAYFAAATSKNPQLQKLATVTPAPADVVYSPATMPTLSSSRVSPYVTPSPVTYAPAAMPSITGGTFAQLVAQNPALGAPFTKTLKMSIKGAQRALNDFTGAYLQLTGMLDHATVAALQNFQNEQGLPATGHIDSETANALLYLAGQQNPQRVAAYHRAPRHRHVTGIQSTTMYDSRNVYGST